MAYWMDYICPDGSRDALGGTVKQVPRQQKDTELSLGNREITAN